MATPAGPIDHLKNPLDLVPRAMAWTGENWSVILIALGIGLGVYLLLVAFRAVLLRVLGRESVSGTTFGPILCRAISRTSHVFLALAAARLVVGYAEPPALLFVTVRFLFIVAAVIQAALWLRELILGFIDLRADVSAGGSETLANARGLLRVLVNTTLLIVALIVVLDNLGVNVTGLVAGLGIGGIAIGLAAQGIFSDLFAALSILFDRPFRIGETIGFDGTTARVERIGLKSTRLRALSGETKIISNAQLLGKEITGYSDLDRRRFTFAIGLIYQTPPDTAADVPALLRAIVEGEGAQFIRAGFTGFGASALDFEVQFEIVNSDYDAVYATRHRVGMALLRRFNEAGLSFAYPTQTTFTADPQGRMIMPYAPGPVATR